jgi:uncharacterized protein with HEPN domain
VSKAWQAYALHILDAIERIRRIVQRGDLARDEVLYDATLRNLQTLSEATQRLPEALKQSRPEIPWKQISGFRNILVHNYLGEIDAQTVLAVVRENLPPLESAIRAMLADDGARTP